MRSIFSLMVAIPFLVCLTISHASAAELSPVEGLETLRRAFADIRDFSADIIQEKQLSLMKKKLTSTGVVRFRKPDTFYLELRAPHASKVLLKGNVLSTMVVGSGEAHRVTLPPEQGLGRWFSDFNRPLKSMPEGFDMQAERRGETVFLRIRPRKKGALKELEIAYQPSGKLKKLTIEENNRDRTTITFLNMKKNTGLSDTHFLLE